MSVFRNALPALCPLPAVAQEVTLPPITVTAERERLAVQSNEAARIRLWSSPGANTVVPASEFQERAGASTIRDLLKFTPGGLRRPASEVLMRHVLALALLAGPAMAHVVITPAEAPANSFIRIAFMVGHGCAGAATTAIEVTLPEGVTMARPSPRPGWTIAIEMRDVARPIPTENGLVRQAPAAISWSGGSLPDAHYEEFVMLIRTPDRAGASLAFPVVQRCEGGARHDWVEMPAEGVRARSPAPTLRLDGR